MPVFCVEALDHVQDLVIGQDADMADIGSEENEFEITIGEEDDDILGRGRPRTDTVFFRKNLSFRSDNSKDMLVYEYLNKKMGENKGRGVGSDQSRIVIDVLYQWIMSGSQFPLIEIPTQFEAAQTNTVRAEKKRQTQPLPPVRIPQPVVLASDIKKVTADTKIFDLDAMDALDAMLGIGPAAPEAVQTEIEAAEFEFAGIDADTTEKEEKKAGRIKDEELGDILDDLRMFGVNGF